MTKTATVYFMLLLASLMVLSGCSNPPGNPAAPKAISELNGIRKYEDGNVTCYVLYQDGISCVKTR